jgi:hypothetical protein
MTTLTTDDCVARAAAYERCAAHLEGRVGIDSTESIADAWLARKLRSEAESWKMLATNVVVSTTDRGQSCPFVPAPKNVGKPLTDRMVESLVEMKRGTKVESEEFFSWPRWKHEPGARLMSIGCPTRAMLEGLQDRGLMSVSKAGRQWITTVNDAGLAALLAHEQAMKAKKPSIFKEYGTSYAVTNSRGTSRCGGPRVNARTESEAIGKVKTWVKDRHIGEQVSDIRIDWKPTNA